MGEITGKRQDRTGEEGRQGGPFFFLSFHRWFDHTMNLVYPTTTSFLTFNHNERRRNPSGCGWIIPSSSSSSSSPFLICSASPHSNVSVSTLDNATVSLFQASCDQHLQSACSLRVRTFCHVPQHTFRAEVSTHCLISWAVCVCVCVIDFTIKGLYHVLDFKGMFSLKTCQKLL